MQKDTFTLFAGYNKSVNKKMDAVIKTLSREEWDKDLGGYFKSVRGLCSHLYICDYNWLKRFSKFRAFDIFTDSFFNREPYSFKEVIFEDMGEYLASRPLLDEKIIAFADGLTDGDLNSAFKYTDSHGKEFERNFGTLVMHTFNHETFHRGMVSLYLELLGRENDFSYFEVTV